MTLHPFSWPPCSHCLQRRLRRLRSDIIRKYPRCSLRAHFTYSDAEVGWLLVTIPRFQHLFHAQMEATI